MTYRMFEAIPVYNYSNTAASNKNLGGDTQVTTPYSLAFMPFPPDLTANDRICFRGAFNNSGNDWDLKVWITDSSGLSGVMQTETFSVPTADSSSYPVVEGRFAPSASLLTELGNDGAAAVYVGGAQTASAGSGYSVHGFVMWVERG